MMRTMKSIERDYEDVFKNYNKYDEAKETGFDLIMESKKTYEAFEEFEEENYYV